MLLVEERVERGVEGLNLRLRRAPEESMPLSEFDGVVQHVQLGERLGMGFRLPVLMDIAHCSAPGIDIARRPVVRVKQAMMQLLQPT